MANFIICCINKQLWIRRNPSSANIRNTLDMGSVFWWEDTISLLWITSNLQKKMQLHSMGMLLLKTFHIHCVWMVEQESANKEKGITHGIAKQCLIRQNVIQDKHKPALKERGSYTQVFGILLWIGILHKHLGLWMLLNKHPVGV